MNETQIKNILEAALFASGSALSLERMQALFGEKGAPSKDLLRRVLLSLRSDYEGRGVALVEVSSGWRFQTQAQLSQWVSRLWEERAPKYSRALLETLALIAYRQPVTRGEIEDVRGVAVSSNIVRTLLERQWVRIVGHRDVPGRPALYGTTRAFLDYFSLASLNELPPLSQLRDIDNLNQELELEFGESKAGASLGRAKETETAVASEATVIDGKTRA